MDELVRQYLVKRGFNSAALELDRVLDPKEDESKGLAGRSLSKRIATINVTSRYMMSNESNNLTTEELIVWGLHSGDVSLYKNGYELFRSWAYGSLDLIKNELLSLCFPLFAISYISLIRKGYGDAARELWTACASDHKDWHAAELQALSMLTTNEQLQQEEFLVSYPFVHCAHLSKFKVQLSTMVVNLLTTFLAQNDLLLVAAMVNEKIQIERSNLFLPSDDIVRADLQGYDSAAMTLMSRQPIHLGTPGSGIRPDKLSVPDFRNDELYYKWFKNIILRKFFTAAGLEASSSTLGTKKRKGPASSSSSSSSATPSPTMNPLEPSIIFATFTNIGDSLLCLNIDRDVRQVVGGCRDSCVRVWSTSGSESSNSNSISSEVEWEYSKIIPWQDASAITLGSSSGYAQSGSAAGSFKATTTPSSSSNTKDHRLLELRGHSKPVYSVAQNSDSRLVLSSSADETIRLWDVAKQQCVAKYACMMPSWDVAFGPVDYYFASANMDRTMTLFSTDRLEPVRIFGGHSSDVTCCHWHGNASLIATGSDDKTARLWDVRAGGSVRVFAGSHSAISCCTISNGGNLLAVGCDSGAILLWDMQSGIQLGILRGHSGPVYSLAFCKDGSALTSGGADCSVRVWDINAAQGELQKQNEYAQSSSGGTALKLSPVKSFYSKLSPVFYVGFNEHNMVYAGGPFTPLV